MIDIGSHGWGPALKAAVAVAIGQWLARKIKARRDARLPKPPPPGRRKYREPDYWGASSRDPCANSAPSGVTAGERIIDATGRATDGRLAIPYSKTVRPAGE